MKPKPTVLIYNRYFNTFGGGERSALSVGLFFESIGCRVLLASLSIFNHTELLNFFGFTKETTWENLIFNSETEIESYVKEKDISVFVNHTYGSFIANRAPIGIYLVMFPHRAGARETAKLKTYTHIISISSFSDMYVESYWKMRSRRHVLVPPISYLPDFTATNKEKLIINIGRFAVGGHLKNQHLAISTFKELNLPHWKLFVAGHVGKSRENIAYFNKCKREAEGANIEVLSSIDHPTLVDLYKRASLLWQLTGCQTIGDSSPELCEHLGLVALDCFTYGVVPIVFYKGGVASIIRKGENGFLFANLKQLKEKTLTYVTNWESKFRTDLTKNSLATAKFYSFEKYKENFNKIIYE